MGQELAIEQFAHRRHSTAFPDRRLHGQPLHQEEWKMVVGQKIMHAPDMQICATCVRVPVLRCHSEAINVEFDEPAFLAPP
jgi:aspartate-semialdehyde dehydrogenase